MSDEPVEIYSTDITPDITSSLEVLAFLLVPERLFIAPDDSPEVADATRELLREAKVEALRAWYSARLRPKR